MSTTLNNEPSHIEILEKKVRDGTGWPSKDLIVQTIVDISNEIPNNVNTLNPSLAEYLAGRFLQGMILTGDLASIALQYEFKMDISKKRAYGTAMIRKAPKEGFTRQKDAEQFAYTDQEYIEACGKYNEARAFRAMLAEKHKAFEKAHHLMRKIAENRMDTLGSTDVSQGRDSLILDNDWEEAVRD